MTPDTLIKHNINKYHGVQNEYKIKNAIPESLRKNPSF